MAVGAHADDVELHFGGTLLKYQAKGYQSVYVQSTNNMSGRLREWKPEGRFEHTYLGPAETMAYRKRECDAAAVHFKTKPIHLDHPQRHYNEVNGGNKSVLRTVGYGADRPDGIKPGAHTILTAFSDPANVQQIVDLIFEHDPEVIFTHGYAETNPEHYATLLLVATAYWAAVDQGYGGNLLFGVRTFRELGRFGCCWETWVDITDYFEARMDSVFEHVSQYPPDFTPGRDHWRQVCESHGKVCGVQAAEIFNFVNTPDQNAPGELMEELLANRADKSPWGL